MRLFQSWKFNFLIGCFGSICSFISGEVEAAPCCARSSATPSLIVGDDLAQVSVGISLGTVIAERGSDGIPTFLPVGVTETRINYRIDGAFLLSDRFQLGTGLSVVRSSVSRPDVDDSNYGLGDTRISGGYEFLPEWSYSRWRPQGFVFSVITLPTGRSLYESQSPSSSDIMGNGFYMASLGVLLLKRWTFWDAYILPEVHYSLPRTFQSPRGAFQVAPGVGGSLGLGLGLSPGGGALRVGVRIQPAIDQGKTGTFVTSKSNAPSLVRSCDMGFDLSYLFNSSQTLMLSYMDQTILGPAENVNLSRSFAINFQHRWER